MTATKTDLFCSDTEFSIMDTFLIMVTDFGFSNNSLFAEIKIKS